MPMSSEPPSMPRLATPLDGWSKHIWARHSQPGLLRPHELMGVDTGLSLTANRLAGAVIQRQTIAHYTNETEPRPIVMGIIIPVTGQEATSSLESTVQSSSAFTKIPTPDVRNQYSRSSPVDQNVNPITSSPPVSPSLVQREAQRPIRKTSDTPQVTDTPLAQSIRSEAPSSIGSPIMRRYKPAIPAARSQKPLTLLPRLEDTVNREMMPQQSTFSDSITSQALPVTLQRQDVKSNASVPTTSQTPPTTHQGYDTSSVLAPMAVTAIHQNSTYTSPPMTLSHPFAVQRRAITTGNSAIGSTTSDSFNRVATNTSFPTVQQQPSSPIRMTDEYLSRRATPLIMRQAIMSGNDGANPISGRPMLPDNSMTTRTFSDPATVIMRQTDSINMSQTKPSVTDQDKGDTKAAAPSLSSAYDTDTIVEMVMRQLMRRLSIESERRGIKRWF